MIIPMDGSIQLKLSEARARKLMTREELAKDADVSISTLYNIERGNWLPSLATARRLAHALGMAPEDIDEIKAAIEKHSR